MTLTFTNYSTKSDNVMEKPRKTRIACYERVSTEEQVHGYSIAAQKASLTAYCAEHDYVVIGHYTDEGVSGGKPAHKRPAMARLLRDVEHGLIDLIIFCKLDRWFRNVQEYFKTQEVLDAHGVQWNAIQEDYETETASGRMTVTIMLSVAQNERERTAERIKAVFDYRAAKGEFLTGGRAVPFGYKLIGKHLEKDPETAPMLQRFFDLCISGLPISSAARTIREEFGLEMTVGNLVKLSHKPIYAGIHNGQSGYCPAYITESQYNSLLAVKGTRAPKDPNRFYLFTGLLVCPGCHRKLTTTRATHDGKDYIYYVCKHADTDRDCTFTRRLSEVRLESVLTAFLFKDGQIVVDDIKPTQNRRKSQTNAKQIESKMRRLAETYTDGLISHDTYKRKLADLTVQLEQAKATPSERFTPPVELIKQIASGTLADVYSALTRQEKKEFWLSVFTSIIIDENYNIISAFFNDANI